MNDCYKILQVDPQTEPDDRPCPLFGIRGVESPRGRQAARR
jgi:hypothetical protein